MYHIFDALAALELLVRRLILNNPRDLILVLVRIFFNLI
jgi:hypothetical protein